MNTPSRAFVGGHVEKVLAVIPDLAGSDLVARMSGQGAGERALA
jgi:hypothetical protein